MAAFVFTLRSSFRRAAGRRAGGGGSGFRRAALAVPLVVLAACGGPREPAIDAETLRAEVEAWRAERLAALEAEDGWLSVVELAWLEEGENRIGSWPDAAVVLPADKAPPEVGEFLLHDGRAAFRSGWGVGVEVIAGGEPGPVPPGHELALATDADGEPTVLGLDGLRFYVIDRNGRLAVRVKDPDSPARRGFEGIDHYPVDPSWRVTARFEPHDAPRTIRVPNILGTVYEEPSPGQAVFRIDGSTYRLDAVGDAADGELFFVFGDATNGESTYGGGRFLYAAVPDAEGRLVLDFNRAYNPPCAFTAFATCPLPPPGNDLPVAVEAGEKSYHGPGGHV